MSYSKTSNIKCEKLSEKKNLNEYEAFLKQFDSTLIYHSEPFLRTLIKVLDFNRRLFFLKRII